MTETLDSWQARLERHFDSLRSRRRHSGTPVFAIEHGLSSDEFQQIAVELRTQLEDCPKFSTYWLLWAIYATEQGYAYGGGEYWRSFEAATHGWKAEYRDSIVTCFTKFRDSYNGFRPSGAWAEHFSIISWPITHAVLPLYLQKQFVHALFNLRFKLARSVSIESRAIGRLIANNVDVASTRFEQFLQQEELVGRIALAILHRDPHDNDASLLASTLERIVTDLERMRHARSWLAETSRIVGDRFKGVGKGPDALRSHGGKGSLLEKHLVEARPDIKPNLYLRHAGQGHWTLVIDVPNFREIASLNPHIRQFLKGTRVRLNGGEVKRPAGWVVSGNRRAVLRRWPEPSTLLVGFELSNGEIDHLLEGECRMNSGPIWLFRIGRDGIAREVTGRIVRPNLEYVIVSLTEFDDLQEGMAPCTVECANGFAVRVSVPSEVSETYEQWLLARGMVLARTIRVWPAGFSGRNWDGEGRSEWLTTEQPCFGIVPDHPVDSYFVTLDDGQGVTFRAGEPGDPTFIRLPKLSAGRHGLKVSARSNAVPNKFGERSSLEGFIELRVREPRPWIPGTTSHAGLVVIPSPHDATLDVLWENELDLTIMGPEGRQVTPRVSLENSNGEEIYSAQVCSPVDLPIHPEVWRKKFQEFLKRDKAYWHYLEAASGFLVIDGQALGRFVVQFNHDVKPVRWVLRPRGESMTLRLVDDTGQKDMKQECGFFGLETPTKLQVIKSASVVAGLDVQSPGGLFIAQNGKFRDLVVVSTGLSGGGLEGLGVHPVYDPIFDSKSIVKRMRLLRVWKSARLAGNLANVRRSQVVAGMSANLYGALAGQDWERAEVAHTAANDRELSFSHLLSLLDHRGGFPTMLRRSAANISGGRGAVADWYVDLAARYDVSSDKTLCTLAIDIASRPHEVPHLYGERLPILIESIKENPLLLRGARVAVLSQVEEDHRTTELLPRWG